MFAALSLRFGDEASLKNLGVAPGMTDSDAHARHRSSTRASSCRTSSTGSRRASTSIPGVRANTPPSRPRARTCPRCSRWSPKCCASRHSIPRSSSSCAPSGSRVSSSSAAIRRRWPSPQFQPHLNPYPKGDIRYVETIDESIASVKAVTREQVRAVPPRFLRRTAGAVRGGRRLRRRRHREAGGRVVRELEEPEAVQARRRTSSSTSSRSRPRSRRPTRRRHSSSPA